MESDFDIITFDCYGTLIDWETGIVKAFQNEAARDGLAPERDAIIRAYMQIEPEVESERYRSYREVLTLTAVRVASTLGWQIDETRSAFLPDSVPSWQPFADTNRALEHLASRFRLGILSNIDDDILAETRKHFPVEFEPVITAQQVQSYKPGEAHFVEARKRIGGARWLHAAQSYFHDIMPTAKMGIPNAWVNRKAEVPAEGGPVPTLLVSDMASLAGALM